MKIHKAAVAVPPLRPGDPRVGHLLGHKVKAEMNPRALLVGFPCDIGVKLNGGRVGAASAPHAIRNVLEKFTPDASLGQSFVDLLEQTLDIGDVIVDSDIEVAQHSLSEVVNYALSHQAVPIILGGGHETTYGHFLGYAAVNRPVTIVNLDAHPDVRDYIDSKPHSGSSFRGALLHPSKVCKGYVVVGLQPQSCSAEHLRFVDSHPSRRIWASAVTEETISEIFNSLSDTTLVSIDLDVVDQAFAPGVSAPCADGISPKLLYHFAYQAGRSPFVASLDIVELNPQFDHDGHTARRAALTVWHFLRGLALRE